MKKFQSKKELLKELIKEFYPHAKEQLGFEDDCGIFLVANSDNAVNPFGKTAEYHPNSNKIRLFISDRHPKDILRSLSHELVHHKQNCDGKFQKLGDFSTEEGYAQSNPYLREMEKEAFLTGNMVFRDYEDKKKTNKEGLTTMSNKDWKDEVFEGRHNKLFKKLMEAQGIHLNESRMCPECGKPLSEEGLCEVCADKKEEKPMDEGMSMGAVEGAPGADVEMEEEDMLDEAGCGSKPGKRDEKKYKKLEEVVSKLVEKYRSKKKV
jgi:hypothetical protein